MLGLFGLQAKFGSFNSAFYGCQHTSFEIFETLREVSPFLGFWKSSFFELRPEQTKKSDY